jgi:hypothetical protein
MLVLLMLLVVLLCTTLQVDMASMEEVDEIARRANSIPISCSLKLNMDGLLERIWDMMALVRGGGCAFVASCVNCAAALDSDTSSRISRMNLTGFA